MAAASRISTTIDFDAPGRQTSFLRLPHSVHESAYGWIPIPIVCMRHGDGPTVLLMAGNHGDEYEGQVTLMKLIRELDPDQLRGRLIILPAANFPAVMAARRTSPLDGGNLNRSFPGDPAGSPTAMIAHYIDSVLLPMCDYALDLHSGGSSLMYVPCALGNLTDDAQRNGRVLALLQVFGAPLSYVSRRAMGGDVAFMPCTARRGVIAIATEAGGAGTVTPAALRVAETGVRRVLRHIGVWPDAPVEPGRGTRILEIGGPSYFVYAMEAGLYEPLVELGDTVQRGQPAARVHFPHTPWRAADEVCFEIDGVVVCKRVPGQTQRGDCLFHLGTDYLPS